MTSLKHVKIGQRLRTCETGDLCIQQWVYISLRILATVRFVKALNGNSLIFAHPSTLNNRKPIHSNKILTIQQGEPCYLSIWSNPWRLHKKYQTPRVKPCYCLPRISNGTNSPRPSLLFRQNFMRVCNVYTNSKIKCIIRIRLLSNLLRADNQPRWLSGMTDNHFADVT